MLSIRNAVTFIGLLTILFGLIACGGGSDSSLPSVAVETKSAKISGYAHLGPIQNGDVSIYSFTNGARGTVLGTAKTNSQGFYNISLKESSTPILVCIKNGSYREESTNVEVLLSNQDDELCAVSMFITEKDSLVSITFFTHIGYGLADYLIRNNLNTEKAIEQANKTVSNWVGALFNVQANSKKLDIVKEFPKNIRDQNNNVGKLTLGVAYGFANAAVSSFTELASQSTSTVSGLGIHQGINSLKFAKEAFIDINENGILDGKGGGTDLFLGTNTQIKTEHYRNSLASHMVKMAGSSFNVTGMRGEKVTPYATAFNDSNESIFGLSALIPLDFTKPIITVALPNNSIFFGTKSITATIFDEIGLKSVKLEIAQLNQLPKTLVDEINLVDARYNLSVTIDTELIGEYPDGQYQLTFTAINSLNFAADKIIKSINISNKAITLNVVGPSANLPNRGNISVTADVVDGANGVESITLISKSPTVPYSKLVLFPTGTLTASHTEIIDSALLLGDGKHTITVTAKSTNQTTAVKTISVLIDNYPPESQILNISAGDIISGNKIISRLNGITQTQISAYASDRLGPNYIGNKLGVDYISIDFATLKLAGQSLVPQPLRNLPLGDVNNTANINVTFNSNIKLNGSAKFPDGNAIIQLSAFDKAGNRTDSNVSVIIDNTPPSLTVSVQGPAANLYIDKVPVFATATDASVSGLQKTEIFIDNAVTPLYSSVVPSEIPDLANISIWLDKLVEGNHTVEIKTTDKAGLTKAIIRSNVGFDKTKPTLTPIIPTATSTGATQCTISLTIQDPGYSVTANSTGSGLANINIFHLDNSTLVWTNPLTSTFTNPGQQTVTHIVPLQTFSGGFNRFINVAIQDKTTCLKNTNGDGGCQHGINANLFANNLAMPLTLFTKDYCISKATGSTVCTVTEVPRLANGAAKGCPL